MSTRANIVVVDSDGEKLFFYKHSDGYPKHTMPLLEKFLQLPIRNDVGQAAGWLVVLGRDCMLEHDNHNEKLFGKSQVNEVRLSNSWKVGWIEPTTCIHGDIEFLYVINVSTKKIAFSEGYDFTDKQLNALIKKTQKKQ